VARDNVLVCVEAPLNSHTWRGSPLVEAEMTELLRDAALFQALSAFIPAEHQVCALARRDGSRCDQLLQLTKTACFPQTRFQEIVQARRSAPLITRELHGLKRAAEDVDGAKAKGRFARPGG
jgi:hypothetical protein